MIGFFITVIDFLSNLAFLIVIAYIFMGYFLDPYHSLRRSLGKLIEPLLVPIRRVVPPVGMFDFSPLVLIILLQLFSRIIIKLLLAVS